jgi:hypothetical protein
VNKCFGAMLVTVLVSGLGGSARAEGGKDVNAILDKAINALGGAEKLASVKAATWKFKGTITFGGDDNKFSSQVTMNGLHEYRSEFEGEFMGNKITGVTVLNGDKGWRKFNDQVTELDKDGVVNEKRNVYLSLVPGIILPLKTKHFKLEAAGEEKVDDKPTVVLKGTGPDEKDFTIYFSKETGLPVKLVATKVAGFMGDEATQEWTYGGYKDFDGIKKATKITIKRGGDKFMNQEVTEFTALKDVDAKTFTEPK